MGVLWSPSYFFAASCGVAPLDIIRKYIEDQRATQKPRLARLRLIISALKDGVLRRVG